MLSFSPVIHVQESHPWLQSELQLSLGGRAKLPPNIKNKLYGPSGGRNAKAFCKLLDLFHPRVFQSERIYATSSPIPNFSIIHISCLH